MSMDRREADLLADNPDSNSNRSFNATTSSSSSAFSPDSLRNVQAAFKRHRMMPQLKPRRLVVRGETTKSSDPAVPSNMRAESPNISLSKGVQDHNTSSSSFVEQDHGPKKVQFALQKNTKSHETERAGINQSDVSTADCQDARHQNYENMDVDFSLKTKDEVFSSHIKSTIGVQDHQINRIRNFLQSDFGQNMTQSSVVGSSCATTTLVNSEYAPMLNSTTHNVQSQPMTQVDMGNPSRILPKYDSKVSSDHLGTLVSGSHLEKSHELSKDQQGKDEGHCGMTTNHPKGNTIAPDITDIQSQAPVTDDQFSNVKTESSKSEKKEKGDTNKKTRKRNYDPDMFFQVNGKLYQRLGKIGSGGSSEVHKVISQDCTIYALKKIKLKGRDYATAYGFCQEIEYLNKLKGRDHIIQLIDYEVTDRGLLKEVLSGCLSNKNGKVKDDGYIYMVLEYGEIDLAHMLSHKWKELDKSNSTIIDENWLRFYWQQILLAVKTIHEERIVHSDLKPANFLLVRGSLKLIDFGIAKAIMSDTTNIQRDSQVGTLSYMSPEAFMCNETDANGNIIKCGRPSDIWSLGCILYQMVYGRTPFSDQKTFWAKFKVVTDPSHEIQYQPLPNPWLLDLMNKCLAWDRDKRWKIPQLLQHPFLVPPIEENNNCKFIQLVSGNGNQETLMMCSRIQQLLSDPLPDNNDNRSGSGSRESISMLLKEMSELCVRVKEQLGS